MSNGHYSILLYSCDTLALPGFSISTWQVVRSKGGIMLDIGLRKLEVAVGKHMERN
jgi:hypothetical protein